MYQLIKKEGSARLGRFETVHGTVRTPGFMNVATAAAIKGGLSAFDLRDIRCQVMLCNTYHLHVRTGDEAIRHQGGGRHLPFPYRRQKDLYGAGGKHADPVQSRLYDRHGL